MILKTDHTIYANAHLIHCVFQESYAVEALLLQHENFPPLKRTIEDIMQSKNLFYAYFSGAETAAVMELEQYTNRIHIRSLTVLPKFFRNGIGRQLLTFVRDQFSVECLTVETGHQNKPAVNLYLNFGFTKDRIFMTEAGIEKISFTLLNDLGGDQRDPHKCVD